jgi:RNA polymerase sigma-70 factor, ECF subfamily
LKESEIITIAFRLIKRSTQRGDTVENNKLIHYWYEAFHQDIYNFLVYYIGSTDVEDFVQEVFIKAYQKIDYFKGNSEPKTWLISIARNLAIDHFRKNKAKLFLPASFLNHLSSQEKSPQDLILEEETKSELYRSINSLKPSHRDILILRGILDLSPVEAAAVLNWNTSRVNLTYHRAIKALKKKTKLTLEGSINDAINE